MSHTLIYLNPIKRPLSEIIPRFFEPILLNKWYLVRWITIAILLWFFWIFNVYMLKEITKSIELWNKIVFENLFISYVIILVIYYILNFVMRDWWWAETYYQNVKNIHRIYVKKFISLDNNAVENIWTGKMISLIDRWISAWTHLITDSVNTWTKLIITIIFSVYMIFTLGWIYFIFCILFFIWIHYLIWFLNKFAMQHRKRRNEIDNEYTGQLVKILMSKFEILQNNKTAREIEILDDYSVQAKIGNLKVNHYLVLMFGWTRIILSILLVWIYYFVWYWIFKHTFTISDLVGLTALLTLIDNSIWDYVDFYKSFTQEFSRVLNLWDNFDEIKQIKWYNIGKDFTYKKWNIKIENLIFGYQEDKIFKDFSLEISWWIKTAFVWESGSGKSTLVKLIVGYLHPEGWKIIVDSQNLSETKLKSYYQNIGYLTQDPSVFDGTILENLSYWSKEKIPEKVLKKAISQAECSFIYDLKNWLDTEIWERWVRLSGWQKQRLAIAKIFIKNPKIILLDEPTSALDSFSEEKISTALNNLFKWRTVIIVAHRLQTVKQSDDIIVLEKWKIIERWNHEKLMKKKWVYYKMIELQSGF